MAGESLDSSPGEQWQTPLPERIPGVLEIIPLPGEIDLHVADRIAAALKDLEPANVIVDCRNTTYIDSSGLGVLTEAMQNAEIHGAQFGLLGIRDSVRPIFEITGLDRVFTMIQDAAESFAPFTKVSDEQINAVAAPRIQQLSDELMAHFVTHPELLHDASPRQFEHVVMSILTAMGYQVRHVGGPGDKGRDLLATLETPLGTLLVVVQCKRYAPDKPIPPDMVRSFMFVVNDQDRASYGLLATTSRFGPESFAIQREFRYRLGLADFDILKEWLSQYGKWRSDESSHLWIPSAFRHRL